MLMRHNYSTPGHRFTEEDERLIKDLTMHGAQEAMKAIFRAAELANSGSEQSVVIGAICSAFLCVMESVRKDNLEAQKATDAMIGEILKVLNYNALRS